MASFVPMIALDFREFYIFYSLCRVLCDNIFLFSLSQNNDISIFLKNSSLNISLSTPISMACLDQVSIVFLSS